MRTSPKPTDHRRLLWTVAALFACFAAMLAWESDKANDQAIRIQMIATRSQ